jgi:hypothetical protein
LKHLIHKLRSAIRAIKPVRVLNYYDYPLPPRGRALVSYISRVLLWNKSDKRFNGHSNLWESTEIVRIFNRFGYVTDVISFDDSTFIPQHSYDVIFDIHFNLTRYSNANTLKIFHVTGSHPLFSTNAELSRLNELSQRRGVALKQRRASSPDSIRIFDLGINAADLITLIGNKTTLNTFSNDVHNKIVCVTDTGSYNPYTRKPYQVTYKDEFLWFGGFGAVHKGLDLVLEVFARNPRLTLHVVGAYIEESDFMNEYRYELTQCKNIHGYGYLYPSSKKFANVIKGVSAFISPSCSEGISTAAITCMQAGIIPIISKNNGIDITSNMGVMLNDCAVGEIEKAILLIKNKSNQEKAEMSFRTMMFSSEKFSREMFSKNMYNAIKKILMNNSCF